MTEHRLRVDWIRCEGFGLCGDYAPALVDLDEWGYPILRSKTVAAALLDDAQRIVDCCPVKALHLERMQPSPDRSRHRRHPSADRAHGRTGSDPLTPFPGGRIDMLADGH
jgi:ferredoxin